MKLIKKIQHTVFSCGCEKQIAIQRGFVVCSACGKRLGFRYTDPSSGEVRHFPFHRTPHCKYYINTEQLNQINIA